jgi:hypothetical protein
MATERETTMSEILRKLLGKTIVVTLQMAGANPIKGTLTAFDDKLLVVDQLRGTHRIPVHIPFEAVLFFIEEHEGHHP